MNRRSLTVLAAALALFALCGGFAYAATTTDQTTTAMTSTMPMGSTSTGMSTGDGMLPTGPNFDRTFIDNMVPHHKGAIAMARIELAKGTRLQLRALARGIITAQNSEIGLMKGWRSRWYGSPKTPAKMSMSMPGMNIASLQHATDVDRAFLTQMIPHHQSAVMMATQAKGEAHHPEVRALAARIIKAQQREIAEMQRWRKSWYG
jgi:uncharacterized protein (DUF305 family)